MASTTARQNKFQKTCDNCSRIYYSQDRFQSHKCNPEQVAANKRQKRLEPPDEWTRVNIKKNLHSPPRAPHLSISTNINLPSQPQSTFSGPLDETTSYISPTSIIIPAAAQLISDARPSSPEIGSESAESTRDVFESDKGSSDDSISTTGSYQSLDIGYESFGKDESKMLERGMLKVMGHMSDTIFDCIARLENWTSWQLTKRYLQQFGCSPQKIECCPDLCVAFTGKYINNTRCPTCNLSRLNRPPFYFWYFSIISRLKKEWASPLRAKELLYRRDSIAAKKGASLDDANTIEDIYDGYNYKQLVSEGYFGSDTDVLLSIAADGAQIFKEIGHPVWPVIWINHNLPPIIRMKAENLPIALLIPGEPKDINSFLGPFVEELLLLENGVAEVRNGMDGSIFTLRAHPLMVTGDMPGVAKLFQLKGHNGLASCRFCDIRGCGYKKQGSAKSTLYCPLIMPTKNVPVDAQGRVNYSPTSLPLRTHKSYQEHTRELKRLEKLGVKKNLEDYKKNCGIKGKSVLTKLKTLRFPDCVPLDIMHALHLNVTEHLFNIVLAADQTRAYPEPLLETVGLELVKNRKSIPGNWNQKVLRNIFKHHNGFKAAEWKSWLQLYALPSLENRIPKRQLDVWSRLAYGSVLAGEHSLDTKQMDMMRSMFSTFVTSFEEHFYKYDYDNLNMLPSTVHSLLHISDCVTKCGPPWVFSQYPMERVLGILTSEVRNRSDTFPHIAENIRLRESCFYVGITPVGSKAKTKFEDNFRVMEPTMPSDLVEAGDMGLQLDSVLPLGRKVRFNGCHALLLADDSVVCVFNPVVGSLVLSVAIIDLCYEILGAVEGLASGEQAKEKFSIIQPFKSFTRCILASDLKVGSVYYDNSRNANKSRVSSWVSYLATVDTLADRPDRPPNWSDQIKFAEVQYYLVLEYRIRNRPDKAKGLLLAVVKNALQVERMIPDGLECYYSGKRMRDVPVARARIHGVEARFDVVLVQNILRNVAHYVRLDGIEYIIDTQSYHSDL